MMEDTLFWITNACDADACSIYDGNLFTREVSRIGRANECYQNYYNLLVETGWVAEHDS